MIVKVLEWILVNNKIDSLGLRVGEIESLQQKWLEG